jgi:hypothetical protein
MSHSSTKVAVGRYEYKVFVPFLFGYGILIVWFRYIDHYHSAFSARGPSVIAYNVFRIAFIFYFFAIIYGAGSFALRAIFPDEFLPLSSTKKMAVGFLTGAGIFHVTMLVLGFLNLYTFWVAIVVSLPPLILGYAGLRCHVRELLLHLGKAEWLQRRYMTRNILCGCCLVAGILLLLVKGLYPSGGHDYFNHYFHYYQSVIRHHGLWPNEVWLHFYYSKGAGLYFLAILLTDPLAPQLVTFCFIAVSAISLFHFARRVSRDTMWPWVAALLYLSFYIYTPGQSEFYAHGGWGDFEKLHELNAALVISTLWLLTEAIEAEDRSRSLWMLATVSASVTATIINVTIAPYLGFVVALVAVTFLLQRNWRLTLACISLGLAIVLTSLVILTVNYAVTGLVNEQGVLLFWPFANIEKLYQWGALPLVIFHHQATTGLVANSVPVSLDMLRLLALSLRLDLLWPLIVFGLLATLAASVRRIAPVSRLAVPSLVLCSAFVAFAALAIVAGRSQPISFFRHSSFVVPITIVAGIVLWEAGSEHFRTLLTGKWHAVIPIGVAIACLYSATHTYLPGKFSSVLSGAALFASGKYSIDDAYTHQLPWPGRLPWGAIYSGSRGAYNVVGPGVPVWSFHVHTYCMLPNCRIQQHNAFILARDLDEVLFGSPERAREVLQASGHNYFLFSKEIGLNTGLGVTDFVTRAPLFDPENIGRYLGVRWTDGNTALLTWLGPESVPLDPEWVASYRTAVQQSRSARRLRYATTQKIYQRLRAAPHPWSSFVLPWGSDRRED